VEKEIHDRAGHVQPRGEPILAEMVVDGMKGGVAPTIDSFQKIERENSGGYAVEARSMKIKMPALYH